MPKSVVALNQCDAGLFWKWMGSNFCTFKQKSFWTDGLLRKLFSKLVTIFLEENLLFGFGIDKRKNNFSKEDR